MSALKGTQQARDLMSHVRSHKTTKKEGAAMGHLDAAERKALPKGDFAIPENAPGSGSYPIPDLAHARAALSRVAANGTAAEQQRVRAAVYAKFPQLKPSSGGRRGAAYDEIIARHASRLPKG